MSGLCPTRGAAAGSDEDNVTGICAGAGEDFQPGALSWRKKQLCCPESERERGRMIISSCFPGLGVPGQVLRVGKAGMGKAELLREGSLKFWLPEWSRDLSLRFWSEPAATCCFCLPLFSRSPAFLAPEDFSSPASLCPPLTSAFKAVFGVMQAGANTSFKGGS